MNNMLDFNQLKKAILAVALHSLKLTHIIFHHPAIFIKHLNFANFAKLVWCLRNESLRDMGLRIESYLLRYIPEKKEKLELFKELNRFEILRFNQSSQPLVSIIIPVQNEWTLTYTCLQAIYVNTGQVDYEIILIDDASAACTGSAVDYLEGIQVLRFPDKLGLLRQFNQAADKVRGKYILFLRHDTKVQKGWLQPLLDLMHNDRQAGLVGSKLLYPDGKLQEAGGIIWRDGAAARFGRFDNPEKPEYNYVKEVDFISGAIMMRADLWREIGGFDLRYTPGSMEEADLAFEVREKGYKVLYQPKSVVVHVGETLMAHESSSGVKRAQAENQSKFLQKWGEVLAQENSPNGVDIFCARDRSLYRKTILVIDHYVPRYDKDAGSRTTFHYLNFFAEMGFNVKFIGDNFFCHEPYTSQLQQIGVEVLYGNWYKNHYRDWIKANASTIDYVYLNRPNIAVKYLDFLKKHTKAKVLYYGHDLHYLRELREYEVTGNRKVLKSSERWRKLEFEIIRNSDVVYYPSQVEVSEIKQHFPLGKIKTIPAYIFSGEEPKKNRPLELRRDLLFVGGFQHRPNIDAVLWFLKDIFPYVLREIPGLKLYIIGANPPEAVRMLESESVHLTGAVSEEELQTYYQNCRLAVIPLRYGAGIKGKLIEAMYYQIPVITTSIGAEGLKETANQLFICAQEDAFAQHLIQAYDNYELLNRMVNNSRQYVQRHFSKENVIKAIRDDVFESWKGMTV